MVREIRVGDFFHERKFLHGWDREKPLFPGDKKKRSGMVLEVHRDPEGDGVIKVLLSGGGTEGWGYRAFLEFHDVYR